MSINYKKQEEEVLALSYSLKLLKAWFSEIPEIEGILYIDWIPEAVRTLLKDQIDYRQLQIRISKIAEDTWLTIPNVRKLMKTKTLTELEAFKKVWDRIIIPDLLLYSKEEIDND